MNYYNEFDPKAAAWLRQLIANHQIPQGYVDDRSITEVQPSDLSGFTQCHFFAGIGGWSLALRLAGWPDDRPVWTASLPCQPFSVGGKQLGTEDERHLAPVFLEFVRQCRPSICFGEQVASKLARDDWFPGIRMEFEVLGYAVGAADLCAPCAGEIGEGRIMRGDQESWERIIIGQPHIRQRLYWVAHTRSEGLQRREWYGQTGKEELPFRHVGECGGSGGVSNPECERLEGRSGTLGCVEWPDGQVDSCGSHILLPCRDGKTRRTQRGVFPISDGVPRGVVPSGDPSDPSYANNTAEARAVRLKGYGNAIAPYLASLFIRSASEL